MSHITNIDDDSTDRQTASSPVRGVQTPPTPLRHSGETNHRPLFLRSLAITTSSVRCSNSHRRAGSFGRVAA